MVKMLSLFQSIHMLNISGHQEERSRQEEVILYAVLGRRQASALGDLDEVRQIPEGNREHRAERVTHLGRREIRAE